MRSIGKSTFGILVLTLVSIYGSEILRQSKKYPGSFIKHDGRVLPGTKELQIISYADNNDTVIPETYDARLAYPNCSSISLIQDQGSCNANMAVTVTSVISDRICIASNQTRQTLVSAYNLLTCCMNCGGKCSGRPLDGFYLWRDEGVVTGGPSGSEIGCQPYEFIPCNHFPDHNSSKPDCAPSSDWPPWPLPVCQEQCFQEGLDYGEELNFGALVYGMYGEENMQQEILKYGPILAQFEMRTDFYNYTTGIYQTTSEDRTSWFNVRILGWGVEDGVKYWIGANTWGDDWGENGFFRFLRGENHCRIEDRIYQTQLTDWYEWRVVRILGWGVEDGVKYWIGAHTWGADWGENGFFRFLREDNHCRFEDRVLTGIPFLQ